MFPLDRLIEFSTNHWPLIAALAVVLALLAVNLLGTRLSGLRPIGPAELVRLINHEGAVIVDVRSSKEFAGGHVLGARNIPVDSLPRETAKLSRDASTPVVLCCETGHRARNAAAALRKAGLRNLYNLDGGLAAWRNASLPLERGA